MSQGYKSKKVHYSSSIQTPPTKAPAITLPLNAVCFCQQTLPDYAIDRTLGTGSFGRVLLVQEKGATQFMACKIIGKERVVKTRQIEHTITEKNILFATNSKFIVKLYDYFQDGMLSVPSLGKASCNKKPDSSFLRSVSYCCL